MSSAATVTVDFAAETARFTAELKKVNASLKNLEGGFASVSRFARGLLPVLSVGAIAGFTRSVFQAADALGDTAQRIGVSVESLSRLKFAAEQNDVEFEALSTSLGRFQRTLSEATSGGKAAAGSFADLGLSAASIRNLALEDQLASIADAFQDITNPADRTRIAMELFGRSGGQLVPLLAQGSAGIKQLTAEADRLGITLNVQTSAGIDAADKALKKLKATVGGFFANRIGGLAASIFGTDDELANMATRIERLTVQRDSFLSSAGGNIPKGSGLEAELQRINAELALLEPRFRSLNELRAGGGATATGGRRRVGQTDPLLPEFQTFGAGANRIEESGGDLVAQFQAEDAEKFKQQMVDMSLEVFETVNQLQLEAQRELGSAMNEEIRANLETRLHYEDYFRDQNLQRQSAAEQALLTLRQAALGNALGALRAFAGESKNVAKAIVLIEKGRAIAQATQLGFVSIAQAAALPWPANIPAIAWAKTLMAANIAGISATGVGQMQSISASGGAGAALGSPSNPVFTEAGSQDGSRGATGQSVVQVIFNGNIYNTDDFKRTVVKALQEEINDRDVVVIGSNSRQAMDMRGDV